MNDAADPEQGIFDWLNADDPTRDAAGLVMPHLDYESQLIAILELLRHQRQAEEVVGREIDKLKKFAERTRDEHAIDEWIAHISQHTYHAAAHSMAAVGMIAPFTESVFYHAFRGIERAMTKTDQLPFQHERCSDPLKISGITGMFGRTAAGIETSFVVLCSWQMPLVYHRICLPK